MNTVTVPVKSAITSKVNWLAALTAGLASANEILNQIQPILPAPYNHDVTIAIMIIGAVSTVIARTFYTTELTTQSAAKVSS